MKKTILKDDNGKSLEVDVKKLLDHLNEYHKTGISTHTQSGCSFCFLSGMSPNALQAPVMKN